MKILIYSVAYHPFVGGAEVAVKEITDRTPDAEFHLVTVNLDCKQKREEKIGNVFVHRVGYGLIAKYFFPLIGVMKGLSLHKKHNFDIVWSVMASYSGFAALFFKYLKPRTKYVLTLQEGDPISHIMKHAWFVYPLFRQIFTRADKVQVISNYLADFARRMGVKKPIDVIPNGVDVPLFSKEYSETELASVKNTLGKKPGDIFIITTSRLVKKNGVGDVISALALLPEAYKFIILGTGELERQLRTQVRKLGVENRVQFVGFVSHAEIPKYLKVSDVFIRPSLSEGMGNSFVEAMAAGLPIVATNVGGIPDFLYDGETGVFCTVGDARDIADKILHVINDLELRATIIEKGRVLAVQNYGWDDIATRMAQKVFLGL